MAALFGLVLGAFGAEVGEADVEVPESVANAAAEPPKTSAAARVAATIAFLLLLLNISNLFCGDFFAAQ